MLTVGVLGDIESAKDNDCFLSQVTTVSSVFWVFGVSDPKCQVSQGGEGPKAVGGRVRLIYS